MKAGISPLLLLHLSSLLHTSSADIVWPLYNQQCQDDAGTPFLDDEETYGPNGFYHDKSGAYPVLLEDGKCAKPLEQACSVRPSYKAAYLEGPIDCGDNGWYCRIMPDNNWPPVNLIGDLNFGHCNTTDGFEDAGYDRDGHCHGSSVDSTYYWWVRDHFFRAYNGRLRCCCGWYDNTSIEPLYNRRIANRCDYRRLVTQQEDVSQCRDANEEHGLGFDDIGCDPQFRASQLNKPIPENDDICWEVQRFGATEEDYDTPTANPATVPTSPAPTPSAPKPTPTTSFTSAPSSPTELPPVPEPTTPPPPPSEEECSDSPFEFRFQGEWVNCEWVDEEDLCSNQKLSEMCPSTCESCGECADSRLRFRFTKRNGRMIARKCGYVRNNDDRCDIDGISETCRDTCGSC